MKTHDSASYVESYAGSTRVLAHQHQRVVTQKRSDALPTQLSLLINMTAKNTNSSPSSSPALHPRRVRIKAPSSLAGMLDDSSSSDLTCAKPGERASPKTHEHRHHSSLALNLRRAKRRLLLAAVSQQSNDSLTTKSDDYSDESKEMDDGSDSFPITRTHNAVAST